MMRAHDARLTRLEARAPRRGALMLRVIVAAAQGETLAEKQAQALADWERQHGKAAQPLWIGSYARLWPWRMRGLNCRLRALEEVGGGRIVLMVVDDGETPEEALARTGPSGAPPRAQVVFIVGVAPRSCRPE